MSDRGAAADHGPSTLARLSVAICVVLLAVPAILDIEAWPVTAWRLFSLSRDNSQTEWVLEAQSDDGSRTVVLEELPLRFRHAAWPMADLPEAGDERREEVCRALFDPTSDVVAGLASLSIVRDRQTMVQRGGDWVVDHDPEIIHTCEQGLDP